MFTDPVSQCGIHFEDFCSVDVLRVFGWCWGGGSVGNVSSCEVLAEVAYVELVLLGYLDCVSGVGY
jgi:hypothetical protein